MTNESAEQRAFRDYLRPVLKRWWLILAVVPVVTVGTYLYYDHKPKVYTASTELFVRPPALDQLLLGATTSTTTEATVQNLSLLVQTRAVANLAAKKIAKSPVNVPTGSVSAVPLEKSNFIVVTATASSPRGAAVVANAYASAFIKTQGRQLHREAVKTLEVAQKQLAGVGTGPEDEARRQSLEETIQIPSAGQRSGRRQHGHQGGGTSLAPSGPRRPRPDGARDLRPRRQPDADDRRLLRAGVPDPEI